MQRSDHDKTEILSLIASSGFDLPTEVFQLILLFATSKPPFAGLEEAESPITNLMYTSQLSAELTKRVLRNPDLLLPIMSQLSPSKLYKLIKSHFSPTSKNYQYIKSAAHAESPTYYAIICFALITDDVKALNWKQIQEAIDKLKLSTKMDLRKIESSLMYTRKLVEAPVDYYHSLPRYAPANTYANFSGLDFTRLKCSARSISELDWGKYSTKSNIFNIIFSDHFDIGLVMLRRANYSGLDLRKVDFRKIDLSGATFRGADLQYARLPLDLHGIDFSDAILKNVYFSPNTNLSKANFSKVVFTTTRFSEGMDLTGANFSEAIFKPGYDRFYGDIDLRSAKVTNVNFSGAKISRHLDFSNNDLKGCDFRNITIDYPDGFLNFDGADLRGAKFTGAMLSRVSFNNANLSEVDLSGTILTYCYAKFTDAILKGANLKNNNFAFSDFSGADLRGADLQNCNLNTVSLIGANLSWANLNDVSLFGAKLENADFIEFAKLTNPATSDDEKLGLLKGHLEHLDSLKLNTERSWVDSNRVLREHVLSQVLKLGNITLLQAAYEHPYFSRHKDLTAIRSFLNTTASHFFHRSSDKSLIETTSQSRLKEQIDRLSKQEVRSEQSVVKKKGVSK